MDILNQSERELYWQYHYYWSEALKHDPGLKVTADFETRSACDLKKHGSYRYSRHPTTEVMCLHYKLPDDKTVRRWHMAHPQHFISESPVPIELLAFIEAGGLFEAHNAFFERMIWRHIMHQRKGWPDIPHLQYRCSAAKASACSLPRALGDAGAALDLDVQKNEDGRRLMLKMSKPRKMRKDERAEWREYIKQYKLDNPNWEEEGLPAEPILYYEEEEDIYGLWDYCDDDVLSEEALSEALPDLSPYELRIWQMDQRINERGVRFDIDLAEAALFVAQEWKKILNKELEAMTGIAAGTKRAAVKQWLADNEDLHLADTTADTVEWVLSDVEISGRARRVLEILVDVNRTSTRKYQTMIDKADPDDWRIRDLLMYWGANTGRWAGKGVQVHNFPARNLIVKDFDEAAECIKTRDVNWCQAMYGDVMKLLSHALRGAIIPAPGNVLMVADYSAIEARVVLWLAGAISALEVFRGGGDIYCDMASGIYGFNVTKANKEERQFGKQSILGLGYGMGFITFLLTCRKYDIHFSKKQVLKIMGREKMSKYVDWVRKYLCLDGSKLPDDATPEEVRSFKNKKRQASLIVRRFSEARENVRDIVHELALMKYTVDVYRRRYGEVKQMWTDQENAVIEAIETKQPVKCGMVEWRIEGRFLLCILPSGRALRYCDPKIKPTKTSWGEVKPGIRYMSVDAKTKKWVSTHTYGGKLVENITQAVARDIMAHAMLEAEDGELYEPGMSVHDELVSEAEENNGSIEDYERLMSDIPIWAEGCPITAEAECLSRYKK